MTPTKIAAEQEEPVSIQQPVPHASQKPQESKAATCSASPTPALAEIGSQGDGKETLASTDGKETLGKETLPPVGELVGQRLDSVNPGQAGPPVEYLNKNPANPLLTPPNPVNVSGPVVSAETRPP